MPITEIMQISGHKNIQSINNYSRVTEKPHRELSNIISTEQATPSHVLTRGVLTLHPVSQTQTSTMTTSNSDVFHGLFAGPIHRATFNININPQPFFFLNNILFPYYWEMGSANRPSLY